ncbi:MAG: response regulator transcription factor [Candidatus Promineifilaceae bacterium]
MENIRLVLVDDHAVVRSGLRMLLESQDGMIIVGEAASGKEPVALVCNVKPDIVLMDVQMPDMNGIEATREIKQACSKTAVIALTIYENDQYFFEMLKAGASGYVPKRAAPDELVRAIETVMRGDVYLYPTLATMLVKNFLGETGSPEVGCEQLTTREQEVLTLIAEGHTNVEIAQKLFISAKTVDRHRENIMSKLNLHSRVDLVKFAIKKGFISLDG